MVVTLPRSSPGSGPVVVETERGGVFESSLTFSYIQSDDSTTSGGGVGGARLASVSSYILTESPLLSNRKSKQSGKP